jgi:DNA-binding NarL/FixJ family response regulator
MTQAPSSFGRIRYGRWSISRWPKTTYDRSMQPYPERPASLRVVVIDADDRVRESLTGLLCIGDRIEVVGSAGETGLAIDIVLTTLPDIVIVDPRLPGVDAGLTLIRRLRAEAPGVRILIMSGTDDFERSDLVATADAYVRKTFRPSDLVAAVVAAAVPIAG